MQYKIKRAHDKDTKSTGNVQFDGYAGSCILALK